MGGVGRARLVVLAADVRGRWPQETMKFLISLAAEIAGSAPVTLLGSAHRARFHRWASLLACSAPRGFALSLLDRRSPGDMRHE